MTTPSTAQLFVEALCTGNEACFDQLSARLDPSVDFVSAVSGPTQGPAEVIALLQRFQAERRFAKAATWDSSEDDSSLKVTAELPLDSFYARYVWDMALDAAGHVTKITQSGIANTEPLPPSPVRLNEEITAALSIAGATRNPLIVAYVDAEGRPSQAPRGTVQVFSDTQLALWLHNPFGGLATAVGANNAVSLHYWGGIGTEYGGALLFQGRARIEEDEDVRTRVYEGSPPSEQRSDPQRNGSALIVEVESVTGFMAGTRYNMRAQT
jgi:hypothetical protein